LAIYHLTVEVISRARGHRVVAVAAARSATRLYDAYYGATRNFTRKHGVEHSEILAPEGLPAWVHDRAQLWNRVEATERRRDSQLARALEVGLPIELTLEQSIGLMREYLAQQFVSQGMVADFSVHRTDPKNPHAQVLLTLRTATVSGFGPKERHWNRKTLILNWRAAWAQTANRHLATAGHDVRIDHRTLEAQQIELAPSRKTGVGHGQGSARLPSHLMERIAAQQRIAEENGASILDDPSVALRAFARQRPTFTRRQLAEYLRSRTAGAAQLDAALAAIMTCNELVALDPLDDGQRRFTSRDLLEAQKSLTKRALALSMRRAHAVSSTHLSPLPQGWSEAERSAFVDLVGLGDFKACLAPASSKRALLAAACAAWQAQAFTVVGVAHSESAGETLYGPLGIKSHTLSGLEHELLQGRDSLTQNDVLIVDGAEMIGLKSLERLLAFADKARAKIVLFADPELLRATGGGSPLRALVDIKH
jgi:Ti-type conjugative transfer relaxase TraA